MILHYDNGMKKILAPYHYVSGLHKSLLKLFTRVYLNFFDPCLGKRENVEYEYIFYVIVLPMEIVFALSLSP